MPKKIPKKLKQIILKTLAVNTDGTLTASQICERVNADQELPENQRKNAKQMAHVMKVIAKDHEKVETIVLSSNGVSHHGNARFRVGYAAPNLTLAEAADAQAEIPKPKLKQMTVNLPEDCVVYLKVAKKELGLSPGRAIEQLIRADISVNGLPAADTELNIE
jgi:hypothetical protein